MKDKLLLNLLTFKGMILLKLKGSLKKVAGFRLPYLA